ncbi:UPF0047 protein [Neolecta irregularis DAH-3]|uniref:UPF0047 protein n=1 Tax=Neolecta irregularis (strain DAH-3) TaxID=1198029 RepID=A0A1U7LUU6_NEOID|nr:UPF0047 protein [Neolecta irregularis DAH-3]|eukprot:OLL26399.1 UPF0047 protein [Neolecta irregularis DAH-3]
MSWHQSKVAVPSYSKGCHLITHVFTAAIPEIKNYKIGILNLFIQHTSAALSVNENCDSDVRRDLSDALDRIAPERGDYRHSAEGPDDQVLYSEIIGVLNTNYSLRISSPRSSEQASVSRYRTVNWHWVHGREYTCASSANPDTRERL